MALKMQKKAQPKQFGSILFAPTQVAEKHDDTALQQVLTLEFVPCVIMQKKKLFDGNQDHIASHKYWY